MVENGGRWPPEFHEAGGIQGPDQESSGEDEPGGRHGGIIAEVGGEGTFCGALP